MNAYDLLEKIEELESQFGEPHKTLLWRALKDWAKTQVARPAHVQAYLDGVYSPHYEKTVQCFELYESEHNTSPTFREIQDFANISSTSEVARMVYRLYDAGVLKKIDKGHFRGFVINRGPQ